MDDGWPRRRPVYEDRALERQRGGTLLEHELGGMVLVAADHQAQRLRTIAVHLGGHWVISRPSGDVHLRRTVGVGRALRLAAGGLRAFADQNARALQGAARGSVIARLPEHPSLETRRSRGRFSTNSARFGPPSRTVTSRVCEPRLAMLASA